MVKSDSPPARQGSSPRFRRSMLDVKLLRDLRRLWSQALTIALVVASGVAAYLTSLSAVDSLALARDQYYAESRFADLFAAVKRAPRSLEAALREVPGVAEVQLTVEGNARVEIPGSSDPIVGQLIGISPGQRSRLNQVMLSAGQDLRIDSHANEQASLPAWVNAGFARARGLHPGDHVRALINGRYRILRIVGIALSPEYIFAGLWGMPDLRGFGVFWVNQEALEGALDMRGAFNRLSVKLAPGASAPAVQAALLRLLTRFGGNDVHTREEQTSHQMLDNEIKEQRVLGTVLPAIFLCVSAFLLNVVVGRLVGTQREQIATLKALGYDNRSIALHFIKLVLVIVAAGIGMGAVVGKGLGYELTRLYAEFFYFPQFHHRVAPDLLLTAALVAWSTSVLGALHVILATVRLPAAQAMRPPAPARYRRTLVERLGLKDLSTVLRMTLRNMERRPLRTVLSMAGVATAVAITILGSYFHDAIDAIIDTQFNLSLRGDSTVWMIDPVDESRGRRSLSRLDGVAAVESTRLLPVQMSHAQRQERVLLRGFAPRAELYRVVDVDNRQVLLEGRGLLLTDRLAAKLGVHPGDTVWVEPVEGRHRRLPLVVAGTVRDVMGLNAYMDREALNRALGDTDLASGFVLSIERGREAQVLAATQRLPRVAGAFSKASLMRSMQDISARNVRIMSSILSTFAVVIAVGVVYNNARILLAERGWELASLRVLGFTRAEVSAMLLGELALVVAVALPIGMALGMLLVHLITQLLQSDQFFFPVVTRAATHAWAVLCVVTAAAGSAWVVRRRVDRLDLVAVLKTRE